MRRTKKPEKEESKLKVRTATSNAWHEGRYDEAFNFALLGLTNKQMAEQLGVALSTFESWMRNKEGFKERINEGKLFADSNVANALYNNAVGGYYKDTYFMTNKVTIYDPETGHPVKSYNKLEQIPVIKHKLPDTKAAIKWLQVRQPELWNGEQNININAQINTHVTQNIDLTDLDSSQLALLEQLGLDIAQKPIRIN